MNSQDCGKGTGGMEVGEEGVEKLD